MASTRALLLVVALVAASCGDTEELAAPPDVVATVDGGEISLTAETGRPRLLWFWGPF